MKKSLKVFGVLLLGAIVAYGCFRWSGQGFRHSVEETRRQLRAEGFRTELSDFDFTLTAELAARSSEITSVAEAVKLLRLIHELSLMERVGTNLALAISPVEVIETDRATNLWPLLRQELSSHDQALDHVCSSLMAGPVKFPIQITGSIRLPHLSDYKRLAQTLAPRAVLAMHEHDTNGVFTNLLALSRMATAWTPEPTEVSLLVRFSIVNMAQQAIWESMQTDYWTEPQLAALQREWESVRLFEGLPDTAELSGADLIRICRDSRNTSYSQQIGGWGPIYRGALSSPMTGVPNLWATLQGYRQHASYRNRGSYEDEQALLLYFHARHQELQRAVACSSWAEMRSLPGVTNAVAFQGAKSSRMTVLMNLKRIGLGAQTGSRTVIGRAAETEARRRLIVTALALERFALQHKEYPPALTNLVPAFLPAVPQDFMDGQPLRYLRSEQGRYLLYSVGLDCVDNGGQMVVPSRRSNAGQYRSREKLLPHLNTDITWPRPATQIEVDWFEQQSQDEAKSSPAGRRGRGDILPRSPVPEE